MNQESMRTTLFIVFTIVLIVTVALTVVGTLEAFSRDTDSAWKFVYYTWSGVLLEIVSFLIVLGRNLFGFHSSDLARAIAQKWALDVVKEASSPQEEDPVSSLNTAYSATKEDLLRIFRKQGKQFLKILEEEFQEETISEVHKNPALRLWSVPHIPNDDLDPVDEPSRLGSQF